MSDIKIKLANKMSQEELKVFRNSFNPDEMGGLEIEGIDDEDNDKLSLANINTDDIIQYLSLINYTDANRRKGDIKWIVIHYVASTGTALQNCKFFYNTYRGASANYFVGFNGEKYQCVRDEDIAWQCGGGLQGSNGHKYFQICTNSNSIGIEMCVRTKGSKASTSTDWYFEDETIEGTIELVKYLMEKYDIDADHVIRHYDVTGKYCPNPYVRDESAWAEFKNKLKTATAKTFTKEEAKVYVQKQSGIDDNSTQFMMAYKYDESLITKLANAIYKKEFSSIYKNIVMNDVIAVEILKKIGLSDLTIQFLKDDYKFGDSLIQKLAKAMI
jgi:N-acetylmuramoyl-L-alanine amidase CwlA